MLADNFFQDVPDFDPFFLNHAFCRLNRRRQTIQFELRINKRLKQFERHFLRQAALVQFELRADRNNRTSGVVNTFTQQVLTETALLAFQHIGQRLQRAFVGAGNRSCAAAVVKQRVNGFLQHALFVADNNVRRVQFD